MKPERLEGGTWVGREGGTAVGSGRETEAWREKNGVRKTDTERGSQREDTADTDRWKRTEIDSKEDEGKTKVEDNERERYLYTYRDEG